jgi:hypothetical protein
MLGFAGLAFVLAFLLAFIAAQALTAPVRGLARAPGPSPAATQPRPAGAHPRRDRLAGELLRGDVRRPAQAGGQHQRRAESLSSQVGNVVSAGSLVQRGAEVRREGVAGATAR